MICTFTETKHKQANRVNGKHDKSKRKRIETTAKVNNMTEVIRMNKQKCYEKKKTKKQHVETK